MSEHDYGFKVIGCVMWIMGALILTGGILIGWYL